MFFTERRRAAAKIPKNILLRGSGCTQDWVRGNQIITVYTRKHSLTCLVRICIIKDIALDVLMPVLYCRVTALSLYTASNRSNSASALRHITINTRDEWPLSATKQWFVKWGISRLIVSVN